ncbi:hypothetical protein SS50377_27951 [Spironucleus salmonicida]|uniref:Uncharacterized protein n=1 Tax=Spironucleus salmonicida TaxID=348837 RepID=A0A9P8LL13_9EUKA|nr:hypothetical protein SS50377_27951 [Spironucleus salmonicida]
MRGRRDCGNRQRQFSVKDGPMRAARLTHLECALRSSTKILPNSSQNHRAAQRGDLSGCAFQITADREAARANSRFGVGLLLTCCSARDQSALANWQKGEVWPASLLSVV